MDCSLSFYTLSLIWVQWLATWRKLDVGLGTDWSLNICMYSQFEVIKFKLDGVMHPSSFTGITNAIDIAISAAELYRSARKINLWSFTWCHHAMVSDSVMECESCCPEPVGHIVLSTA